MPLVQMKEVWGQWCFLFFSLTPTITLLPFITLSNALITWLPFTALSLTSPFMILCRHMASLNIQIQSFHQFSLFPNQVLYLFMPCTFPKCPYKLCSLLSFCLYYHCLTFPMRGQGVKDRYKELQTIHKYLTGLSWYSTFFFHFIYRTNFL